MSFLQLLGDSMLKTVIRSDFPIECQHGNHLKYPTVVASVIRRKVILPAVPLKKTLLLHDTKLKDNVGNNKCASLTNISLFLISYLNGQTDGKYVFFL